MKKFYFCIEDTFDTINITHNCCLILIPEKDIDVNYKVYFSYSIPAKDFLKSFCDKGYNTDKFLIEDNVKIIFPVLENEIININICFKCNCQRLKNVVKFLGQGEQQ